MNKATVKTLIKMFTKLSLKESLNKLTLFMVRLFVWIRINYQRNQWLSVRPEPVEGLNQRSINIVGSAVKQHLVNAVLIVLCTQVYAGEPTHQAGMMPVHDHSKMNHANMIVNKKSSQQEKAEVNHDGHHSLTNQAQVSSNRNPNAFSTNDYNFSNLSKPHMGDHATLGSLIIDRLEGVNTRDGFSMTYDWQAWYGQDYDKVVMRAEGEIDQGTFKNARNELLWGHALTAFWDTQLGIRYDSGLGAERTWGAFGFQGFAPYWIYVEATGYVGEEGRTAFRLETEYDVLFTQKLILQPRIEMNFYSQRDLSRLVSSGLSNIEAGLRLRYEFYREFAPYIGVEWASTFGSAADVIRESGKKPEETRFIAGVHFWF